MTGEFKELPECPYCGERDHDWWDGLKVIVHDGNEWGTTCSNCGQDYKVTASVDISFATAK